VLEHVGAMIEFLLDIDITTATMTLSTPDKQAIPHGEKLHYYIIFL
jgi:hypothetical protein